MWLIKFVRNLAWYLLNNFENDSLKAQLDYSGKFKIPLNVFKIV